MMTGREPPMIVDEMLPGDLLGDYDIATNTIRIDPRQSSREYLCTLAHEWEHWLAQHELTGDLHVDAMIETEAEQRAARKLIDIRALAEAAAAHWEDAHRVAEELHVDYDTLMVRMNHLHPSERALLKRRMAHARESA